MNTINTAQLKCLNTLVGKLKIDKENKAVMVSGFCGGRATSSKELTSEEAIAMIKHLKSLDPQEKSCERMRRKIIAQAFEIGWTIAATKKIDMKRIDNFCKVYGFKKKSLNNYTYSELPTLVAQFEKVYKDYLNKF